MALPVKISFKTASAACFVTFASVSASDFGHRTDVGPCFDTKNKSPDAMIVACSKALNSHMMGRNGVALALNNLATAYENKGDLESALNTLSAAIKLEGDTWQALFNRSQVYLRTGNSDLALADLNRAIELHCGQ